MRVKLSGINTVTKRLADGSRVTYYYHRTTRQRLPGKPGDPEFMAAYNEANSQRSQRHDNVAALIAGYLRSTKFTSKAESTKKEYLRMLRALEEEFGTLPIKALGSPKVRGLFLDYQDFIAQDRPREADNRLTVMSAVFSHAVNRGEILRNPLERFERVYSSDRSDQIWLEPDVERFMNGASLELQRAMILALHTGQRYGDLIRIPWSDYEGEVIRLRQRKTGRKIGVKCTATLKRMLDETPKAGPFILTRDNGLPWHTRSDDKALWKAWHGRMEEAGFYPKPWQELSKEEKRGFLRFNDVRGTAVTLLAEAGASLPQICSITGHTLQSAARILEKYLSLTDRLAKSAIELFENASATEFANRLQTTHPAASSRPRKDQENQ